MIWNQQALANALHTAEGMNIDIVNDDHSIAIKMKDYGDLQLSILLISNQIIIETIICPISHILNQAEFNYFLLCNQKFLPLSSVGISHVQDEEYYVIFGALSLRSSLDDVILEITTLVANALDLAEVTEEYT